MYFIYICDIHPKVLFIEYGITAFIVYLQRHWKNLLDYGMWRKIGVCCSCFSTHNYFLLFNILNEFKFFATIAILQRLIKESFQQHQKRLHWHEKLYHFTLFLTFILLLFRGKFALYEMYETLPIIWPLYIFLDNFTLLISLFRINVREGT